MVFTPADILLPREGTDLARWACIACDQFTSEPEYWREAEALAGSAPSTLHMIVPEAYLGGADTRALEERAEAAMGEYLGAGVFRTTPDSLVYVERALPTGVRRGLVGALDLEAYDWAPGSSTPVRATEGTVEERLPPRVRVRSAAPVELPHIMVFINDPTNTVIPSAAGGAELYDFELMLGGGHIRGSRVSGEAAERVAAAIDGLGGDIRFAVGDGNHSLAAAKRCWEAVKPALSERERETHPARFALCELVNLHDDAVRLEPIHRLLLGADGDLLKAAGKTFADAPGGRPVTFIAGGGELTLRVDMPIGALIGAVEDFCRSRARELDYIHGEADARKLAEVAGSAAVLLPRMAKSELFDYVAHCGPFPRKSFSIGEARAKRYYLECRALGVASPKLFTI